MNEFIVKVVRGDDATAYVYLRNLQTGLPLTLTTTMTIEVTLRMGVHNIPLPSANFAIASAVASNAIALMLTNAITQSMQIGVWDAVVKITEPSATYPDGATTQTFIVPRVFEVVA